jgi:hypothetical protein
MFQCEIVQAAKEGELRLELVQSPDRHQRLLIRVPSDRSDAVRRELFDRGYRGSIACVGCRGRYGTWRSYLNELEVAHIVVEMLDWRLGPDEQAILDSIDSHGRTAPTGMSSPRLR